MIISKTPLRLSFAGGGTDLPSFYTKNNYGAVFSTSINKYIYVTVKDHCKLYPEKMRFNYSDTEHVNTIDEIKNPIIKECLKVTGIDENLYISTVSEAPASSGLGSSSSFCVGLLNALYAYKGKSISKSRLAEEAANIEINLLNRPIGKQDHYAAAIGGLNYFKFNFDNTIDISPATYTNNFYDIIFKNIFIFWTGIQRNSADVLKEQNEENFNNTDILLDMRSQAHQLYELANKNTINLKIFSEILNEGWYLKRKLSSNVSNSLIDEAFEVAIKAGALGGKLSGAGNGGFLNLIIEDKNFDNVRNALKNLKLIYFPIKPDYSGSTYIKF